MAIPDHIPVRLRTSVLSVWTSLISNQQSIIKLSACGHLSVTIRLKKIIHRRHRIHRTEIRVYPCPPWKNITAVETLHRQRWCNSFFERELSQIIRKLSPLIWLLTEGGKSSRTRFWWRLWWTGWHTMLFWWIWTENHTGWKKQRNLMSKTDDFKNFIW